MSISVSDIKEKIERALPGATVVVDNPGSDGMHFSATVIAEQFKGLALLARHRLVKEALKADFDSFVLHAMSLKTLTPDNAN